MDMQAPQILTALEGSGFAQAIRQSIWIYPAANVGHVVCVALFIAALAVMDLILLGIIDARDRRWLVTRARRAAIAFLTAAAATGALLFTAEASHVALNRVFQVKIALIGLAALNVVLLGGRSVQAVIALPDGTPPPGIARLAAAISLTLWISVAALGRLIAYI